MKGLLATLNGQVSLEILFTTAIGLTFVALAFFYSITSASDTIKITQASDAVDKIARAADLVYALGPGSKTTVDVLMPSGITSTEVKGKRVLIRVSISSGTNDVFALPRENVSGTLTNSSGRQRVTLTANYSGSIVINSTGQ